MKATSICIGVAALACSNPAFSFAPPSTAKKSPIERTCRLFSEKPREMAQMGFHHDDSSSSRTKKKRDQSSLLSAVAIDTPSSFSWDAIRDSDSDEEPLWSQIQLTLSTALLITGNTVGASCLVLPEMAARPGMTASTALFVGTNSFSGTETCVWRYTHCTLIKLTYLS